MGRAVRTQESGWMRANSLAARGARQIGCLVIDKKKGPRGGLWLRFSPSAAGRKALEKETQTQ